mmetsp:Transcript_65297/g.142229  ORF Transcript_65297/g.142229 Transcript_65297/m.142229 type:complete len:672 (+) Transcript_65297:103-2118(+)|eukprot:CAMPEP_0170600868 /NCGR_PEP_ID=MMETSP0224-20130122/17559_1 /TAXON_ID=285029 /ORGANISM="Togula jolla, Strain CCCM 725" /LENGTH=671 /DNA_ID=CAMNT_0010925613 /DNA_START=99 /DNA_END=2114 /DNA_ORIENTATION=-
MEPHAHERLLALPQLQSLMKKDPEAYAQEFDQQWAHFDSMMEMFKLKPQKPHPSFSEQVMFLAHVAPSFPKKGSSLPGLLMSALDEHGEIMHPGMRTTLVSALILLRNRSQYPLMQALPLWFKLFRLQDKGLRGMIFKHIVSDIAQMHTKSKNQKVAHELQDFFFAQLRDPEPEVARRACAAFVSLHRQNVWKDSRSINLMSAGLLHPDTKVAAALTHLFLGNKTKGLDGILAESDDESEKDQANEAAMGIFGAKKPQKKKKLVARAKKAAFKSAEKRKRKGQEQGVSFVAIDMINDPQTLAEKLLQRASKGSEPYLFRLLILHLVGRLVGRNSLQLLNLYPFLLKYLNPSQKEVTKILAVLVEATHTQVPPEELRPIVLHVMRTFVTEAQTPEVIEVGLNAIREICVRGINILTAEELEDLVGFRKVKNKGVGMAVRSLVNAYRELHPQLLHKSLRGREATMAISRGDVHAPMFGNSRAADSIEGIELLSKPRRGGENAQDGEGEKSSASLATETVLSTEDFKRLQKIRLQRSIQLQLGGKRKREPSSSSEEEGESGDASGNEGRRIQVRLPGAVSADDLKGTYKARRNKQQRVEGAKSGFDLKEKLKEKAKNRKGGKTNKEQKRNKPLMMMLKDKKNSKSGMSAKQKMTNLKKHIKTLKLKFKKPKRRR